MVANILYKLLDFILLPDPLSGKVYLLSKVQSEQSQVLNRIPKFHLGPSSLSPSFYSFVIICVVLKHQLAASSKWHLPHLLHSLY